MRSWFLVCCGDMLEIVSILGGVLVTLRPGLGDRW
jgi:hypothetical protein